MRVQVRGLRGSMPCAVWAVWWLAAAGPVLAGVMRVGADGSGRGRIARPPAGDARVRVIVTCESRVPDAGPVGAVILRGRIARPKRRVVS